MHWLWALTTAALAVGQELLFRQGWGWREHWWGFVPRALGVSFSVYKLVTNGPSLLVAIVAFSLFAILLRALASQFLLGEPVARGNLIAVVALVIAAVVGQFWR